MKHADHLCSLALCGALFLAGCAETVTVYKPGSDGRYHKIGTFTPEENWKRGVNESIAQEKAGTLNKGPYATIREYRQNDYRVMRRCSDTVAKSLGWPNSEEQVAYVKQQRREAGLPTYD